MNEDLKKNKQHAYVLGGDEPETIGQQSAGIIIACAERMAEEISRLKAELAKGQELLRCGGCKYYVPKENFCNAGLLGKVSPFDFCFRGQRRESEVGK